MKTRHIIGMALLMAVTGACKKNQETSTFSASIEIDESRTYLDGMKVKWTAGDQIIVYGNGDSKTYSLSSGAGTQTATFTTTGGVQPTDTYRAFYPAASCTGVSGDVFTFTMPATQTYTSGGFGNNLNPMAAKTTGGGSTLLKFKNAFAVLKVSARGSQTVSKVVLTVPSGNYVYGTYTFDYNAGTTTRSSGGSNTLELTCGNGVTLNTSTATDFYFVLPPGTLPSGSTIAFYQSGSNTPFYTTGSTTSDQPLLRNRIYTATVSTELYVTNLLPGLDWDITNWTIEYSDGCTPFANSNYANYGETFYPAGTYCYALTASLSYGECYIKNSSAIPYVNGHQYYVRWWSRKERWLLPTFSPNWQTMNMYVFTQDFYWPIDENYRWATAIDGENPQNAAEWHKNSLTFTHRSTGSSIVRFDFNNANFYFGYFCFSDAMLIDLTETYTNHGLAIPTKAQLDAKDYFVGTITLSSWQ